MINSNWSGSWHLILANYKPLCFWGKKKRRSWGHLPGLSLRNVVAPVGTRRKAVFTWMKGTGWSILQPSLGSYSVVAWPGSPEGQEAGELTRDLESETLTSLPETSYPMFRSVLEGSLGQVTLRLKASVSPSVKREVWTATVGPRPSRTSRSLVMILWLN